MSRLWKWPLLVLLWVVSLPVVAVAVSALWVSTVAGLAALSIGRAIMWVRA